MSKIVKCKACQKEISKSVKICPSCGHDQGNFFAKHKVLTGLAVVVLLVAFSNMGNKDTTTKPVASSNNTTTNAQPAPVTVPTTPAPAPVATPAPAPVATPAPAPVATPAPAPTKKVSYQSILDTYSAKIMAATPKLIEEYKNEAAKNTSGLEGLATLSNAKILKLAEISTEGINEMAKIALLTGFGKYSEYEEWALKLTDVYMKEGIKITDVYMSSAME